MSEDGELMSKAIVNATDKHFAIISIKCPRCLVWSMNDASFCHRCGKGLRPSSEESLFNRIKELLDESGDILEKLFANERARALALKSGISIAYWRATCR
jgi:hypothetical protein